VRLLYTIIFFYFINSFVIFYLLTLSIRSHPFFIKNNLFGATRILPTI